MDLTIKTRETGFDSEPIPINYIANFWRVVDVGDLVYYSRRNEIVHMFFQK